MEYVGAIISFLLLLGGLITVWVNLNTKVKEVEMRVNSMESKLNDAKEDRLETLKILERYNDRVWAKLDAIEKKLDEKFETLAIIKAEHDKMTCKYKV